MWKIEEQQFSLINKSTISPPSKSLYRVAGARLVLDTSLTRNTRDVIQRFPQSQLSLPEGNWNIWGGLEVPALELVAGLKINGNYAVANTACALL